MTARLLSCCFRPYHRSRHSGYYSHRRNIHDGPVNFRQLSRVLLCTPGTSTPRFTSLPAVPSYTLCGQWSKLSGSYKACAPANSNSDRDLQDAIRGFAGALAQETSQKLKLFQPHLSNIQRGIRSFNTYTAQPNGTHKISEDYFRAADIEEALSDEEDEELMGITSGTVRAIPIGRSFKRKHVTAALSNLSHGPTLNQCNTPRALKRTVLLFRAKKDNKKQSGFEAGFDEIFVFIFPQQGTVVTWGAAAVTVKNLVKALSGLANQPHSKELIRDEREFMPVTVRDTERMYIFPDGRIVMPLSHTLVDEEDDDQLASRILDMFAVSDAMAESVRIGISEIEVQQATRRSLQISHELRNTGRLILSSDEVLKWFAEIFAVRLTLYGRNPATDIYWDRRELDNLNMEAQNVFELKLRLEELNEQLDHITEVAELVRITLNERHSHRLEWGIIWLIVIEIIFEALHYSDAIMYYVEGLFS